jgi:hypothetical protein
MTAKKKISPPASKKRAKKKNPEPVPNIKELLINGPRFEIIVPKRRKWRRRPPVIFD